MLRRPGYSGRSKASADTLCQKCLKRDNYECTVSAQERPYKSRPSRTQQLLNPKLKPKLTTEVPNDLLRKKGVADEILAQKDEERGRKRARDSSRKRSRSVSSYSSDSVSTISTNRSRSRSPLPKRIESAKPSSSAGDNRGKRARRSLSSASASSLERGNRNTRRRMSSFSPVERGRRRTRSRSSHMDMSPDEGSRRGGPRTYRSRSRSSGRRGGRQSRSGSRAPYDRQPTRRYSPSRSRSGSPNHMDTSEGRNLPQDGGARAAASGRRERGASPARRRYSQSRSRSPYRRRSPSPYSKDRMPRSRSPYRNRNDDGGYPHRRYKFDEQASPRHGRDRTGPAPPVQERERSLSPYSKRVAMTRALQGGR